MIIYSLLYCYLFSSCPLIYALHFWCLVLGTYTLTIMSFPLFYHWKITSFISSTQFPLKVCFTKCKSGYPCSVLLCAQTPLTHSLSPKCILRAQLSLSHRARFFYPAHLFHGFGLGVGGGLFTSFCTSGIKGRAFYTLGRHPTAKLPLRPEERV